LKVFREAIPSEENLQSLNQIKNQKE